MGKLSATKYNSSYTL